jgi:hypothetical protein
VRGNDEQNAYDAAIERARRMDVLQRAEHEFHPIPLDIEAARVYGRVTQRDADRAAAPST